VLQRPSKKPSMRGLTWLPSRRAWRCQRAVPKHLQPLVGAAVWQRQIGDVSQREAEDAACSAWTEWSNLIAWLEALPEAERERMARAKGLASWRLQNRRESELTNLFRFVVSELRSDPQEPRNLRAATALAREEASDELKTLEPVTAARERLEAKLAGDKSKTLDGLVDLYAKANEPTAGTVKQLRLYMQRFSGVVGDIDPRDVKPPDVRRFRDAMAEAGHTPKNVKKMLEKLRGVFGVGVDEGRCDTNPFLDIKVHGKIEDSEDGHIRWEPDQLRTIWQCVGELDEQIALATKMLIYSGKRPNEVCQLRCEDIGSVDGIDYFHVTSKGEQQSLKVGTRPHDVPLHPKIQADVLDYVKRRREAGKDRLFDFTFRPSVKFSHYYGERFNPWARRVTGSDDLRQSAYSFRHSWEDALRDADVPETVRRQLAGRAPDKGSAKFYGKGSALKTLARWMKKVDPLRHAK
jgi:integrase